MKRLLLFLTCLLLSLFKTTLASEITYDSQEAPVVELKGLWDFFCDDGPPHPIEVPGTWRGYVCPQGKLPGTGRHRYQLVIKGQNRPSGLAIYFPVAGTSMAAYWNGQKIHQAGNPALKQPGYYPAIVPVVFLEHNHLIIEVANFDDRFGGLWHAPQIGSLSELHKRRQYRFALDGFLVGILSFLTIYTFFVYLFTNKDHQNLQSRQYLYLAIFTLGITVRTLVENERIAHILLGADYWYILIRAAHFSLYASFPFLFLYFKGWQVSKKLYWWEIVLLGILVIYDLLVLVTPPVFFTEFLNFAMLASFLLGIQMIVYTIQTVRQRQRGARLFLAGILLLFITGIHDLIYHSHFLALANFELVPLSLLFFIASNIITLDLKQYRFQKLAEYFSNKLSEQRTTLEKLLPYEAQRFIQTSFKDRAMFSSREKISLRFAILFADLRNFTTIAESRTPEAVLQLINHYLEVVVPPLLHYGGQVIEYQGDGILAYFTLGANACLQAALEMQQALAKAQQAGELGELKMGISMDLGEGILTFLGNYQRLDPVLISPAVLQAQDLQLLCSQYQVNYVLSQSFKDNLSEKWQSRCRSLTTIGGSSFYTITS